MSDLDASIKSDLRQYATDAKYDDEVTAASRAVEHIKQAFEDAGYTQEPRQYDVYGNLKVNGQEWYDRFKDATEHLGDERPSWTAIMLAAKKAAGIE